MLSEKCNKNGVAIFDEIDKMMNSILCYTVAPHYLLLLRRVFSFPWRTETREEDFLILSFISLEDYSIRINNLNNLQERNGEMREGKGKKEEEEVRIKTLQLKYKQ